MKCSCPKCSASVQMDVSAIPEKGKYFNCPECKRRFWISRELFAVRAARKRGEIFCAQCGEELNHTMACPGCRALYPELFSVQAKKPVQKRLPEFRVSFELPKFGSRKPYYRSSSSAPKSKTSRKSMTAIIGVTAVAALVIFAGYFLHQRSLEKDYSRNFVRALYAIKSGTDISNATAEKIVAKLNDPGQNHVLLVSAADEARLNKVKNSADILMKRIKNPPKRFAGANENLVRLYSVYSEMNSLVLSPPRSLAAFKNSSDKFRNDFSAGVKDLKANLPEKLSERIKTAQVRYKSLQSL